jgi:cysteine desulfurase
MFRKIGAIILEVYLDNAATTRVDDDIAAVALEVMTGQYGNPSSLHAKGLEAQKLLDSAREKTAAALGCKSDEVFFTSGGTEANNLAVFGAAQARKRAKNIVSVAWEHSSVLEPLRELEKSGLELRLASPSTDGTLDIANIAALIDENTALLACMLVNSEVGHTADIAGLSKLARRRNSRVLIHCDAVQGFGKLKFSVKRLGVDTLAVSGHKLHAPKGVGALYCAARIMPRMFGGGQEKNLRPGTEALPLIAAFGAAAEKAAGNIARNMEHVSRLREYFVNKCAGTPGLCMNSPDSATPYICNVSIPGYRSQIVLNYLSAHGVYVSSGSACGKAKPSHVLGAMGLPASRIDSAIRVSFSKHNTIEDLEAFFAALAQGLKEIHT